MPVHEWSVMVTDYLLAAWCLWLEHRLRGHTPRARFAGRALADSMTTSAVAALLGGTRHGMGPWLPDGMREVLWLLSYTGISLAGTFLLWGVLRAQVRDTERRASYRTLCIFKFGLSVVLLVSGQDEKWVAMSCATDTIIIGWIGVSSASRWWLRSLGRWLCAGAGISIVAGVIQLGWPFGAVGTLHNDLFHLLLMPAMYAYYRAAFLMLETPDVPS